MLKLIKNLGLCNKNPNTNKPLKNYHLFGLYECPKCGKHFAALTNNIKRNKVKQCKSCAVSSRNFKHGNSVRGKKTILYNRWLAMRDRCSNPNNSHYHRYGGRNITVCKEWDNFETFKLWADNAGYNSKLTIDRKDVDKGYSPKNCRFVDKYIQAANVNKRPKNTSGYKGVIKKNNKWQALVTYKGIKNYLGVHTTPQKAAKAYNDFVINNGLPHPINKGI